LEQTLLTIDKNSLVLIALCSLATGCASTEPTAYSALSSAAELRPNTADRTGRMPYRYQGNADWRQYSSIIVDPVVIYSGADNQFGKMADTDKTALASYMQSEFSAQARTRFAIVTRPTPQTLRLRLTLTGAKENTPVLGTVSRFDLLGGPYNAVQAVRGREGTLTGSVNYAVEIYDAGSGRLLSAYIAKQYPGALNVGASLAPLQAAKVGIQKGAEAFVAQMR
jgi:hypothetical protein